MQLAQVEVNEVSRQLLFKLDAEVRCRVGEERAPA